MGGAAESNERGGLDRHPTDRRGPILHPDDDSIPRPGAETASHFPSMSLGRLRILSPGGVFQIYCLSPRSFPRLLSRLGVLERLRCYIFRTGGRLTRAALARLLPPSLEALTVEEIPFQLKTGRVIFFTHGVFRRR